MKLKTLTTTVTILALSLFVTPATTANLTESDDEQLVAEQVNETRPCRAPLAAQGQPLPISDRALTAQAPGVPSTNNFCGTCFTCCDSTGNCIDCIGAKSLTGECYICR